MKKKRIFKIWGDYMNVRTWVNENKEKYPDKIIRIIDSETNKGTGTHWILFTNHEVKNVKITSQWIFLYI
jgi:hypothetical protein